MTDLKSAKELPVRLTVTSAVVGHDTLVLLCGPDTVQVDLASLLDSGAMAQLMTSWLAHRAASAEGLGLTQRLNDMKVA